MKIAAIVGVVVLTSACLLCGQVAPPATKAPAPAPGKNLTVVALPAISTCPVGMDAKQGGSMQVLRAADGTTRPLMTPSLTLTEHDARQIVEATVTAFGFPPQGAAMDLVAHSVEPGHHQKRPELRKMLDLKMARDGNGGVTAQLMLPGFAGVSSIELDSLTYSDGSTWQIAAGSGCRVAPDPLLLVAGR